MVSKGTISLRHIVITGVLLGIMYYIINFSAIGVSRLTEITDGQGILDMEMGGYSVEEAYDAFDRLGEDGRAFNLKYIIPLDILFPITYGLFGFVTLTWLASRLFNRLKYPWLIGLIGWVGTAFDFLENWSIYRLLIHYPERLESVARMANIWTLLKAISVGISMVLILIGVLAIIIKRFKSSH